MPAPSNSTGDPDADAVLASTAQTAPSQESATGDPDADAVIASAPVSQPQPSSMGQQFGRAFGLAGRALATGVGALPLAAMDAGVATRNLAGDEANKLLGRQATADYEMPSKMFQDALTGV